MLEESIDEGTQWVVFEPNDEPLWARVRQTVTRFLTSPVADRRAAGRDRRRGVLRRLRPLDDDAGRHRQRPPDLRRARARSPAPRRPPPERGPRARAARRPAPRPPGPQRGAHEPAAAAREAASVGEIAREAVLGEDRGTRRRRRRARRGRRRRRPSSGRPSRRAAGRCTRPPRGARPARPPRRRRCRPRRMPRDAADRERHPDAAGASPGRERRQRPRHLGLGERGGDRTVTIAYAPSA